MKPDDIIKEVREKYLEHIEMYENQDQIICKILAFLLLQERQYSDYSKKLLKDIKCNNLAQEKNF